jgi:transcriptional regulator with XRE-family HTH domain
MEKTGLSTRTAACQELAAELRRVKRAAGLSFADLQSRTPYSRSSLERYVNGKLFPKRDAVQAMAEACSADPECLLRLWDTAAETQEMIPVVAPEPPVDVRRRWRIPAVAGGITLVLSLGALTLSIAGQDAPTATQPNTAPSSTPPPLAQPNDEWSRKLSVFSTDGSARSAWFEATIDWHGSRVYNGDVHGVVHDRAADDLCAVAFAWYDGQVVTLGQACGPSAGVPVMDEFRQTQRALVRVCLRRATTDETLSCSDWS